MNQCYGAYTNNRALTDVRTFSLMRGFCGLNCEYRRYSWGDMSLVWCTLQVEFSSYFCGDEG